MLIKRILGLGILAACLGWTQAPPKTVVTVEQQDAQRTRDEFQRLLDRYPPTLRSVLAIDHSLLTNQAYLAPYPGLVSFLTEHPEIARNPSFFVGDPPEHRDAAALEADMWRDVVQGLGVFTAFGMAIGLIVWIIRTFIDYRRWSRLAKVQTDVHTKLLDRFSSNEDLVAYIQSPAGSKFLESSPIKLDPGPKSLGAPLGRILWSVQGGFVLVALGIGLQVVRRGTSDQAAQPLHALGILAIALGLGFLFSAIISYILSRRLGLIEPAPDRG